MLTGMMSSVGAGATIQSGELDLTSGLEVEGATVFNDSGASVDFRVEGNTKTHLLFVDASQDGVGINTDTAYLKLHVVNDAASSPSYASNQCAIFEDDNRPGIQIVGSASNIGLIDFGDNGAAGSGGIYYKHASDAFAFVAAGDEQISLSNGALSPITDSDVDLGTSSLYFKDSYIDTITTTGNVTIGGATIATRPSVTNLADDGSILITATCANIDANGGARTGIRFAGTGTAGQILAVNNTGGEALTFHNTEGTALVRGIAADHDTMEANFMGLFISDGSLWNLIAGGVDSQPDVGLTAS
jgi:hypothetical protein